MSSSPKPAQVHQNKALVDYDHPSTAGTTTYKIMKATRAMIVDSVSYLNVTGLAEDTTNVFAGVLAKGTDAFATLFNTDSDLSVPDASIPANAWVAGVITSQTLRYLAPGDELNVIFTEGGNSTLPAGRLVVEFRYV
jgi:hypothetical protein